MFRLSYTHYLLTSFDVQTSTLCQENKYTAKINAKYADFG